MLFSVVHRLLYLCSDDYRPTLISVFHRFKISPDNWNCFPWTSSTPFQCKYCLVQSCLIPATASFLTVSSRCTSPGLLPHAPIAASRLHMTEYTRVVCMHVASVGARLSFSTCIGSCLKYHTCTWKQYAHRLYLILKRIQQTMETTSSNLNVDTLLEQY